MTDTIFIQGLLIVVNVSLDSVWHNLVQTAVEIFLQLRRVDFKGPLPPRECFLPDHHNLHSPCNADMRIDGQLAATLDGVRAENLGWCHGSRWSISTLPQAPCVRVPPIDGPEGTHLLAGIEKNLLAADAQSHQQVVKLVESHVIGIEDAVIAIDH